MWNVFYSNPIKVKIFNLILRPQKKQLFTLSFGTASYSNAILIQ